VKNMQKYPANSIEFKIKRRWWIWVIGILFNILAIRFYFIKVYLFFFIVIICDIFALSEASHHRYIISDKFLYIECIVYPGLEILLDSITAVDNATLMTFRGAGVKIYEESLGAFKITYSEYKGRMKTVIVTPKNRKEFIVELSSRIDKKVILIDNIESAFKKKKDKL